MDIRLAKEADIPGLLALLLQVGQVHHEIRPDIFPERTLKYDETALKELLKDEKRPVFLALDGNFVAGYCFCVHKDYEAGGASVPRRELYIDDLCVDEKHRRRGIAEALYRHALDYAKDCGCGFVTLNVWCCNPGAMAFYESLGMKPQKIGMETVL